MKFHVRRLLDHAEINNTENFIRFGVIEGKSAKHALIGSAVCHPGIYAVKEENETEWTGYEIHVEKHATPFKVLNVTGYEASKETIHGHLAWLCNPTLADDQS